MISADAAKSKTTLVFYMVVTTSGATCKGQGHTCVSMSWAWVA